MLADQKEDRPTHIAEIVFRKPTHLGFFHTSGLGDGVVWLDSSRSRKGLVWRHPWPAEIIADRISSRNRDGAITNSDVELAALIIH